ncbi:MAG TPA: S41 family peptidase [Thermomicrobiales bacterium]|nr:S41 family peptidase [Thermomicrobiales bacterium]
MAPSPGQQESYGAPPDRRHIPRWLIVLWSIGIAVLVFFGGIMVGLLAERDRHEDAVVLSEDWQELGTVIEHLERDSYYRPGAGAEADAWREELERRAIEGLLEGSGDNRAAFLPPAEAARSSAALTGEYEGIGVSIAENDQNEIEVVSVMLDSPAQRADVRVGDVVETVEGTPIPAGELETASNLLRGGAGTDVEIALSRPGGEPYELTLTRERISTGETTVAYRFFPEEDLAIISISLVALTTTEELDTALEHAEEDGAGQLVLDLRGNPGGWVSEATKVVGRFVDHEEGPALLEDTWPAGGGMIPLDIDGDGAERFDGEMLVLVDQHTASASEIVASALQYYDRAVVVGQPSFGKGSVQRVYDLDSGESLRLTVAEWFTPGEEPLEGIGVTPDVELEDSTSSLEELVPTLDDVLGGE